MPNLLQINVNSNWGSTGKIAEAIGDAAIANGWDSYIAYGRHNLPSNSKVIRIGTSSDVYLHYMEQLIRDNEGLCSRCATKKLIRQIREINPSVVHLHNIHDHYLNYKLLFEYLNDTDIKVVWTLHDFWPVTGHCMHFISKKCNRFKTGCYDCPMQKVYPKSLLDRSKRNYALKKKLFSANKSLNIVTVSQWVRDMAKQSFLGDKPIIVIDNGIDLSVFKPTIPAVLSKDSNLLNFFIQTKGKFIIMGVASQWGFDKGMDDYKLISNMLADDEVIVLVGVNDDIITSLPKNIIGLKRTNNTTELAALYTRANVVTILSSAETFGLTVVEGYACGTPAVVYDNTAPPALITPETGFVAPDKDYKAVYNALQKIKYKGKDYYSDACLKVATMKYGKDKCFENYINLYNNLLNQ